MVIRKNVNYSQIIIIFALMDKQIQRRMCSKTLVPVEATHPGELIKDELKERGLTQKQLAEMTGIKASVISETINGKRSVSLNMAVALEKALSIPAEMWMNLQTQYDLDTANIAERENRYETIAVTIPVSDRNLFKEVSRKFGWACML
jgi:addiction module HigA family antidote